MQTSTLLKKAARLIEKKANIILKQHAITHGYTYFLMELFKRDGQTQTELQNAVGGIEHPTVVRTLDRMQRDGLIERKPSSTDRRAFLIYLTDKGRAAEKDVLDSAKILNQIMLSTFSQEEQIQFQSYLCRLIANLES
ncbi:MarR family transporter transcriptional regulator [Legionella nautarum]|uniref:MarR family transporter transcriptional regulator n=1 Tax=Legionella nautarum TaxID=45070 RepID=A0A0W0WLN5_9GAMM|nr:MarR family transcriptional regulator [Legionella nautarum]KTD33223.1 MarR family transporter transcriptional regulator [Legionella nautarum]